MKRAIFTTVFVVCAGAPALSAELEFSADGQVEYDDNVFRTEQNKDDDVLFRLYPGVRIYEDRGDDLNFSVGYTAPVEFSVENSSEFNEVDHVGDGRFNYHVNDRLEFLASDHYAYIRSTLRQQGVDTDAIALAEGFPQFTDQRDRVKVNDGSLGALYRFSPRTVGHLVGNTSFFDSSRSDRSRVWSVGANADLQHKLTLRHQLGAGAGYSYQNFDDRNDIEGSQTNTYRVFGEWRWTITETLTFDLNAGPAYLETKQDNASVGRLAPGVPFTVLAAQEIVATQGFVDKFGVPINGPIGAGSLLVSPVQSCGTINGVPVSVNCFGNVIIDSSTDQATVGAILGDTITVTNLNPSGQSDETVTGFIDAVLSQRWSPTLATALRYTRQQGDASGLGGTVLVDAVSLSNTWDFAERWQLAIRGDWVRRESAFDLVQTFDAVTGQPIPGGGGGNAIARRNGVAFNSKQDVEIDTDRWGVAARITHQLFKNTSIYGQVRYDEQDSRSDTLGNASDFENFLATFGVRHVFEPIPLW